MRSAIVDRPIDPASLLAEVADPANGAALLFLGTVRDVNEGHAVAGIEYRAYREMAERELEAITREAGELFSTRSITVEHRIGRLGLGEASVGIAVAHPHRAAAYDASRFVIEEIKRRVPIWKREEYTDGTREWVEAGSGARDSGECPPKAGGWDREQLAETGTATPPGALEPRAPSPEPRRSSPQSRAPIPERES